MVVTKGRNCYCLYNNLCNRHSHNTMIQSQILLNGLHCSSHVSLIDLRQHVWVLYLFSRLFWPTIRCNVSSCTPVTFQSKMHLHQWSNRKMAIFRLSWAVTKTCCPPLGVCQNSFHLASSWHYRCYLHSCWGWLSVSQDCIALAFW